MSANRGSGVTTAKIMRKLQDHSSDAFANALRCKPTDKRVDAFKEGMRQMYRHLVAMGVIVEVETG